MAEPASSPPKPADSAVSGRERRLARRVEPHEVPWIRAVKPVAGESARLLNISRTGVLLETTTRLHPGRRTTVLIVGDLGEEERAEARVLRTELVSIATGGELVYRTALVFTGEFDLRLLGRGEPLTIAVPPANAPIAAMTEPVVDELFDQSQLEGPLPGVWTTNTGARHVTIVRITQTGCVVQGAGEAPVDLPGSVSVFFSPVRVLTLTACVVGTERHHLGFRFVELSAETRRLLRVEIREGLTERGCLAPQVEPGVGSAQPNESLLANHW